MIYPTDEQLLGGMAEALRDTVLPELARGSAARKQLQAAIEILRRMAFAAPSRDAVLVADNADMAEVLGVIGEIFKSASPLEGEVGALRRVGGDAAFAQPSDMLNEYPPPGNPKPLPTSLSGEEALILNETLQAELATLQSTTPPHVEPQITPLLTALHIRMTDRALTLIPPPMPRTPRTPA